MNTKENVPPRILLPLEDTAWSRSPSSRPSLALQRDHSACGKPSSPLVVRKTRENLQALDAPPLVPPPCLGCAPRRQKSVSRRVLSAVKQGLKRSDSSQRSVTATTVSTTELVSDFGSCTPRILSPSDDEDPTEQTQDGERNALLPSATELQLAPSHVDVQVPYIDLQVTSDTSRIDVCGKCDIWIAISATVRLQTVPLPQGVALPSSFPNMLGGIPSLRLHIQPAPRHRVLQTLGDKSAKQLTPESKCDLFVRLRIPRYHPTPPETAPEVEILLADLESTLGTLETEILHVEARYKHSLIEGSNSVTVRRVARVKRVRPESR